jgi:acetyltransferase-like isoleucine patch superfamily enzyme
MAGRGRDTFQNFRPIILGLATVLKVFPKSIRQKMLVRFRRTTGYKGLVIRYALLKTLAKVCGDNVSVHPDVYLFSVSQLTLGDNVSIHPMCYIDAYGEIDIGSDVSIAHGVTILSASHTFGNMDVPIKDQPVEKKKTSIENNVWIGAKATVLCGNTVHSGSVVAAGAVVTHDVASNTVVAGVPARMIKERVE